MAKYSFHALSWTELISLYGAILIVQECDTNCKQEVYFIKNVLELLMSKKDRKVNLEGISPIGCFPESESPLKS
jgi:hypothetical protein